ncbi:Cap [Circular ssDNA virus sp.]|nr:Cap [Circular ssDNA virus sp.]
MYNSRRLSRSTRTLQRRKVDTGIAIDPSKVRAYMEYLLNNGYVQLPQPIPTDGSYFFTPNLNLSVIDYLSGRTFAEDLITSVLSTINVTLTGSETVYMIVHMNLKFPSENMSCLIDIYNKPIAGPRDVLKYQYTNQTGGELNSLILDVVFICSGGRYSIVLLGANSSSSLSTFISKYSADASASIRSYFGYWPNESYFDTSNPPKVTLLSIGRESE